MNNPYLTPETVAALKEVRKEKLETTRMLLKCHKCGGARQPMRTMNLGRHQDMLICNECWKVPFEKR